MAEPGAAPSILSGRGGANGVQTCHTPLDATAVDALEANLAG
jgi:hypothetical protein